MIRPAFVATLALVALAPAAAQTGYGKPTPQQYRTEQRTTATLNLREDDDADRTEDARANPGYDDTYAPQRYARTPAAMRNWRALTAACRQGDRFACERAGEHVAGADRYARDDAYAAPAFRFRGAGRYDDPRDAPRYQDDGYRPDPRDDDRWDPRAAQSRYDNPYRRDDRSDDEEDRQD